MAKEKSLQKSQKSVTELPHIELYMNSLNQEFAIPSNATVTYGKWSTGGDYDSMVVHIKDEATDSDSWYANWPGNWRQNWITNWVNKWNNKNEPIDPDITLPIPPLGGIPIDPPPIGKPRGVSPANLRHREENFGGIVYDPALNLVFKVNKPGLELLKEIIAFAGSQESLTHKFSSKLFLPSEASAFYNVLREAGYDF